MNYHPIYHLHIPVEALFVSLRFGMYRKQNIEIASPALDLRGMAQQSHLREELALGLGILRLLVRAGQSWHYRIRLLILLIVLLMFSILIGVFF